MDKTFNANDYKDEYQIRLRELIEKKISGQEIVAAPAESQGNVIDLMDALKASIEQSKPERKPLGA
jgi:DNA end-binding protein Ku